MIIGNIKHQFCVLLKTEVVFILWGLSRMNCWL